MARQSANQTIPAAFVGGGRERPLPALKAAYEVDRVERRLRLLRYQYRDLKASPDQDLMNASRSALIDSASVVGMPCGKPL